MKGRIFSIFKLPDRGKNVFTNVILFQNCISICLKTLSQFTHFCLNSARIFVLNLFPRSNCPRKIVMRQKPILTENASKIKNAFNFKLFK